MPYFNNEPYDKFSAIINSSRHYLANYTQDKDYLALREDILKEAKKYSNFGEEFLNDIWLKRTKQGIANTNSNGFSELEFKKNVKKLHELALDIKKGRTTHAKYRAALETLNDWKKAGAIRSVYEAQVARAFATFYPTYFVNWVTLTEIKKILKVFKDFKDLKLTHLINSNDWYLISNGIKSEINRVNKNKLDDEDLRRLITQVYLQNSEYSSDNFEKEVEKLRKKYSANKTAMPIPEGCATPDTIVYPGYVRIIRDPKVKTWVLINAEGVCEGCKLPPPFKDEKGRPFLEVHHMKHLAKKGPDTVCNTVALCPNCHKKIHFGMEKDILIQDIYDRVGRLKSKLKTK